MLVELQRFFMARTSLDAQLYPPLKLPVRFRPYQDGDLDSCLQIYGKNAAGRFPEDHEEKFETFLRKENKTFIVAELNSKIIGYGGITLMSPETSVLCYGIIDPAFQKQRIGATLTLLRIALLPSHPRRIVVVIMAVDASMPVYKRFGFIECAKWKSDDGKMNPLGVICIPESLHKKIKSAMEKREIQVEGSLTLYQPEIIACEVEDAAGGGFRLHFRDSPDGKPASV